MPTYEYECTKCGSIMELFQSITAKPKRTLPCVTCKKSSRVRRLIGTGGGIVFKGSGFYITDYRPDSYRKAAEAEKPSTGAKKDGEAAKPAESGKPADSGATLAKAEKPKKSKKKD